MPDCTHVIAGTCTTTFTGDRDRHQHGDVLVVVKQVDIQETTSESIHELRQLNTDLERELERQRARNEELERQLHSTAQSEVIAHVEENPGATTQQLIQHVADTVPGRVAGLLDLLEGEAIECRDDGYYPLDYNDASDNSSPTEVTDE